MLGEFPIILSRNEFPRVQNEGYEACGLDESAMGPRCSSTLQNDNILRVKFLRR